MPWTDSFLEDFFSCSEFVPEMSSSIEAAPEPRGNKGCPVSTLMDLLKFEVALNFSLRVGLLKAPVPVPGPKSVTLFLWSITALFLIDMNSWTDDLRPKLCELRWRNLSTSSISFMARMTLSQMWLKLTRKLRLLVRFCRMTGMLSSFISSILLWRFSLTRLLILFLKKADALSKSPSGPLKSG